SERGSCVRHGRLIHPVSNPTRPVVPLGGSPFCARRSGPGAPAVARVSQPTSVLMPVSWHLLLLRITCNKDRDVGALGMSCAFFRSGFDRGDRATSTQVSEPAAQSSVTARRRIGTDGVGLVESFSA